VRIGSVELVPLTDSIGELADLSEVYPDVPAEAWQPYRELYPDLFAGGRWLVPCTCYLVRSDTRTILVDTGTGPPGFWDDAPPELEGGLLPALARHGVAPEDVDDVFITHVHGDHIGWNTDAAGEPLFPRARYLLDPEAVARARERLEQPWAERCFRTLFAQEVVAAAPAGTELAPGVVTTALPGHDPGHAGLRISSDDAEAILIGDAIPHPALADQPDWFFKWDHDPAQAEKTRRALRAELVDTELLVACGHYPGSGIGRLRTRDGLVVWEPVGEG
jgi:glyoxylase-like metal-dependent hydrolase (beta-lactamase superfamily II)